MNKFILKKLFNLEAFDSYLKVARDTNQFTNYGMAVQLLEQRARIVLKIDDSKAIIATNDNDLIIFFILQLIKQIYSKIIYFSICTNKLS